MTKMLANRFGDGTDEETREKIVLQNTLAELNLWRNRFNIRSALLKVFREYQPQIREKIVASGNAIKPGTPEQEAWLWNSSQDTRYSHADPAFDHVCHIFHKEWFGIRAAAGNLPGQKLAISTEGQLLPQDTEAVLAVLEKHKINRIVVHSLSDAMLLLLDSLTTLLPECPIFCVWHGSIAQWVGHDERTMAISAIQRTNEGQFKRIAILRGGNECISKNSYTPILLNLPPNISCESNPWNESRGFRRCFIPGWNNYWKNYYTNLLAAISCPHIESVMSYADPDLPDFITANKVQRVAYEGLTTHFEWIRQSDIGLNVSVVDCHPMVNLEFLALGVPCLSGPLWLDILEQHPFTMLTTVDNPMSVKMIQETIDKLSSITRRELAEILSDYKIQLIKTSLARYGEFLEL